MMELEQTGFAHFPGLVLQDMDRWIALTAEAFAFGKPGLRISNNSALDRACSDLAASPALHPVLGEGWRCVRAIAFNKSVGSNWALGWHQDRTIAVRAKARVSGFGHWSEKDGIPHVEPPFALLERMFTLRLHLDEARNDNGALLVAPGSHRLGRVAEENIDLRVEACGTTTCEAEAGDGWLYSTPILHASGRASSNKTRRVLHLDFSRDELPPLLEWHGIG